MQNEMKYTKFKAKLKFKVNYLKIICRKELKTVGKKKQYVKDVTNRRTNSQNPQTIHKKHEKFDRKTKTKKKERENWL